MTPDFLAIGHLTLDLTGVARVPGGSALYTALMAHRLGLRVGVLTSVGSAFPMGALPPGIEVANVASTETTTFEHRRRTTARRLRLVERARPLAVAHLPEAWRAVPLICLCPVAAEVDPTFVHAFDDAVLGVGPQGWMRTWDQDGLVGRQAWDGARFVLRRTQALFLSEEDVVDEREMREWFDLVPVGCVTRGSAGATLFVNGEPYAVSSYPTTLVDPTGAGDVFAAAFLVHYQRTGDAWEAAGFASAAGSLVVEAEGIGGVPDRAALETRWAAYRERFSV
jgi:sugar/nucleoside kinase (ribokinase family)